jgi:hypothetical protein
MTESEFLSYLVQKKRPGQKVELTYKRHEEAKTVELQLPAEPPEKKDPPKYASNLVIGYSQVAQWYDAFESVVENDRWELLWHGGAGVNRWSDPNYEGWSRPIQSPCKVRSADPDRVVLSISGPYGDDVDRWTRKTEETIKVIRTKYNNAMQIVLQPVVGGPTSRAARQHPFIAKAIERVVKADKSGISAGPSPQVSSSEAFATPWDISPGKRLVRSASRLARTTASWTPSEEREQHVDKPDRSRPYSGADPFRVSRRGGGRARVIRRRHPWREFGGARGCHVPGPTSAA